MARISKIEQVLKLVRQAGVVRPKDLTRHGMAPTYLQRLRERGLLTQPGRGLYTVAEHEPSAHHTLASVCKCVPQGVVCLLTALRFHDLGTQNPSEVWLAIDRKAARSTAGGLPVRFVRFSGRALKEGVEERIIEGVTVRITSPAKTVVDCFKYRNKVGLDVGLEALRDGWRSRQLKMGDLTRFAKICRVANVMRPYVESLT